MCWLNEARYGCSMRPMGRKVCPPLGYIRNYEQFKRRCTENIYLVSFLSRHLCIVLNYLFTSLSAHWISFKFYSNFQFSRVVFLSSFTFITSLCYLTTRLWSYCFSVYQSSTSLFFLSLTSPTFLF